MWRKRIDKLEGMNEQKWESGPESKVLDSAQKLPKMQ